MNSKIYLLTFDPLKVDAVAMHNAATANIYVQEWWHYISGTYLLKSQYDLATLKDSVHEKLPNSFFLLIEAKTSNANGWLPQEAWDWINARRT